MVGSYVPNLFLFQKESYRHRGDFIIITHSKGRQEKQQLSLCIASQPLTPLLSPHHKLIIHLCYIYLVNNTILYSFKNRTGPVGRTDRTENRSGSLLDRLCHETGVNR